MSFYRVTIQMKAPEQYFPVVLWYCGTVVLWFLWYFLMLYKVVVTFESVNETLRCDQV